MPTRAGCSERGVIYDITHANTGHLNQILGTGLWLSGQMDGDDGWLEAICGNFSFTCTGLHQCGLVGLRFCSKVKRWRINWPAVYGKRFGGLSQWPQMTWNCGTGCMVCFFQLPTLL